MSKAVFAVVIESNEETRWSVTRADEVVGEGTSPDTAYAVSGVAQTISESLAQVQS